MNTIKAWYLLLVDSRFHQGNLGYTDELTKFYNYDSNVPNYKQVNEGDLAILVERYDGQRKVKGIAKIEKIFTNKATKISKRCPFCKTTQFNKRTTKVPEFLCRRCSQEFHQPLQETRDTTNYTAIFGNSFISIENILSIDELNKACFSNYNKQLSMQAIDLNMLMNKILNKYPEVSNLLNTSISRKELGLIEVNSQTIPSVPLDDYIADLIDLRESQLNLGYLRPGQSKFRKLLVEKYGDRCMITGCSVFDVVEACHIVPYRGEKDNHPANGLLMRADLHILFDRNLLGIEPDSLKINFHPAALESEYCLWEETILNCGDFKPNQIALRWKWSQFQARLNE